ncbi:MAG: acyltransferase [Thermodesulfobacteriota bacterium]|jgi:acetyltransferase-like isoleucine patch superfamily enzyme
MKKWFWYPVANIKNRFLFGAYGKDVYIEPGVVINRPRFVHMGNHVRIKRNTSINLHPKDKKSKEILLFIGDNVIISESCFISACNHLVIEENVGISPNVMIIDNSRKPGDISLPSKEQKVESGYVRIGADSWIAYGACVLPNVTIGKHCIIGALSVVNKDIPPYSVAVGSPAKVVKHFDLEKRIWVKVPNEETPEELARKKVDKAH